MFYNEKNILILLGVLAISIFIIGCTEESTAGLDLELEQLSDEELAELAADDSAVAGQAYSLYDGYSRTIVRKRATYQIEKRTIIKASCGNGKIDLGEECDDGNTVEGDGCSSLCKIKYSQCGDGVREGDEQCDDGNAVNGDGCSSLCVVEPYCGDRLTNTADEECDSIHLAGRTCANLGFNGGTLTCTKLCKFDTTLCY